MIKLRAKSGSALISVIVMMIIAPALCVGVTASDETTKRVAIVPFGVPAGAPQAAWLSDGFPRVLALRLQQLPRLTVVVLSRDVLAGADGFRNPLDSADVGAVLEGIRAQAYDAAIFGGFHEVEGMLRAEIHVWATRPDRHLGKALEQSSERDPDGLGIKLATFIASTLQLPTTDAEAHRLEERYTSSAEAFEHFARALTLAETAGTEEEVQHTVELFKKAIGLDGRFAMALHQLGDFSFRHGHYASAAEAYQAFLGLGKRDPVVYRMLGKSFFAQRDMTRAIDAFRHGLQLDPRDPQLSLELGLAYAAVKNYESARKALLRTLEVKSDDPLAFANLGVVYLLQGNVPAATASLQRAQLLQGSDARLTYDLGLSLMLEGSYDQARDQFARALQLQPGFAAAAYQLAVLDEPGNAMQAMQHWRDYLKRAAGKPTEQPWLLHARESLRALQPSPEKLR